MNIDYLAVDRCGVPERFFGAHPEEFYGAIGRVAMLGALLEHHVRLLAQKVVGPKLNKRGKVVSDASVRGLIARALDRGDDADGEVARFLRDADTSVDRRNFYVHSLWPAQSDGTYFGWKPDPWEASQRIDDETVRRDIETLVELNERWRSVWGLVSGFPDVDAGRRS